MSAKPVDVQISVVNTNNRELLQRCLESLPSACAQLSWSATVVDNASEDGSADLVRAKFPWVKLVCSCVREGFSANHNKVIGPAVRTRAARYVLILNEDTELASESVAKLVACADRNPQTGAVGPRIRGPFGEPEASYFPFPTVASEVADALCLRRRCKSGHSHSGWLNGSCVLVSVDALAEIGDLDERFFIFFEDTDLGRRLIDIGRPSLFCDEAEIVHLGHRTVSRKSSGLMEQQRLRSRYLYFRKHRPFPEAELVSALVRTAFGLRAAKAALAGLAGRDADERQLGHWLLQLARYSPRQPLPHELAVQGRSS
jgi:GT2 family glycosyltransferase